MTVQETKHKTGHKRIILPTVLAVFLFIISIFVIIIPTFRSNLMDRKREMIRELTNTAWSVMQEYAEEETKGTLSKAEAQKRAISDIRYLRYGVERKDYFWITDKHPRMIMHPYKPQMEGTDLSGKSGEDPTGKKLFLEMVDVCKRNGHGFVEYMWQWKDDSTRIVPKLSFVKEFTPWNWIIGTGIYVEDVKEEISSITATLIKISIAIIVIIALLLFYIMQQSLKIEDRRKIAEDNLKESENKYRLLVEAATEGTVMVLGGEIIYSNKIIHNLLGYSAEEFAHLNVRDIMRAEGGGANTGYETFKAQMAGEPTPHEYEVILKKKSGELVDAIFITSQISLGDDKGMVLMIRDISDHKQIEEKLDQTIEKYKILTNNLDIGVFRSTPGRDGKFLEANPAALRLLGFQKEEELYKITVFDLFHAKEDRIKIMKELLEAGFIKKRMLQWKRADGSVLPISISVVLVKDENGIDRYCDGIIEDVTDRKKNDEERENLIIELQTAQLFYNRSIKHFLGDITTCSMNQSIHKAAAIMSRNKCSAILITAESDRFIGIVTDYDLRERVVAENIDLNRPVSEIMSAPIVTIPDSGLIFEAMLLMQEKGVRHLAVKSHSGEIVSLISNAQLFHMQRSSSSFLIREIHEAGEVEEIITTHNRLPRLVKALIDTGSNSKNICRIITAVSDAIVERLIQFAIDEMGPPPAKFAFVALGSEGREEQTLFTDQDNAIIYEDLAEPEAEAAARDYFLKLGEKVCLWLDKCGYRLCEGEIMANNPKWCQPLSKWKAHFSKWINTANPQDLLEINIFFDFRPVYGSREFTKELRAYIDTLIAATPAFLQYIARNALLYKPPLGFFGKIVVESSGENPSTFDIKDSMKPIVNFARIYVLKNNINETNTQQRLHRLYTENILNKSSYDEIVKVYDYLMQMRFKHQAKALSENREPDNFINPGKLTDIEHSLVKNTFSQINNFQKRLSYDFTGTA